MTTAVLAVDLGATSARVCRVDLDHRPVSCEVVHRYHHAPRRHPDGSLRWDWPAIVGAVETGLRAGLDRGPVASIGVDTWGVDYGLLDEAGRLLSHPHSYRSGRTASWRQTLDRIGADRLYRITGIQQLPINTIFQLAAHDRSELGRAHRLLMLPELVVHHLTGTQAGEVTSAGTSGLLDAATRQWSKELIDDLDLDPRLLPDLHPAGTPVGTWRGVPVHLVAGHDTASAVLAASAAPPAPPTGEAGGDTTDTTAFVSTGSWVIVGLERDQPDTTPAAAAANLSNEPGAYHGVRLLKNVTGLVLLERLQAQWGGPPLADLAAAAGRLPPGPVVDVDDPALTAAPDLEATLRRHAGLPAAAGPDHLVRLVLDSITTRVAQVLGELETITRATPEAVAVVGGGTRLGPLTTRLAELLPVPVHIGPAEASATGNALAQGLALGRFTSPAEARAASRAAVT